MTDEPRKPGQFTLEHDIRQGTDGPVLMEKGTKILVTKPMGGALRGANLGGLVRMDYDQVALVGPRITTPPIRPDMIPFVDPADIMQLAGEIVDFLLPSAAKEVLFPSA